jgi:hypothetical protein
MMMAQVGLVPVKQVRPAASPPAAKELIGVKSSDALAG